MAKPNIIRWGIMATGGIARTFTKDLLIDPTTRNVQDIVHKVSAAASSSSLDSAKKFVTEIVAPKQSDIECIPYGSYKELVEDPNVDIVYVASPHSHHYQNCRLALDNGKPILCEKALTTTYAQAAKLYEIAKNKNLFFMEAVWTRFFPLSIQIRKHITDGDIGEVLRVVSDLSIASPPEDSFDPSHRMVNLDLAGGALLDLGVYSLTWVFQTMYHTLPEKIREKPAVVGAAMTKESRTGADEHTTVLLDFPKSSPTGRSTAHAIATTSMRLDFDHDREQHAVPAVRIQGDQGEIQVYGPIFRPTRFKLIPNRGSGRHVRDENFEFPGDGHGMFWEADAAARSWRDKRLEDAGMPWTESLLIMQVMDEVRQKAGLKYPEAIETTEYPVDLSAKAS